MLARRPTMQPAWAESTRRQRRRATVPFFFKQWGGVPNAKQATNSAGEHTTRCREGRGGEELP
jgi:protein gp37